MASLQQASGARPVIVVARHAAAAAETRLQGVSLLWIGALALVFLGR